MHINTFHARKNERKFSRMNYLTLSKKCLIQDFIKRHLSMLKNTYIGTIDLFLFSLQSISQLLIEMKVEGWDMLK